MRHVLNYGLGADSTAILLRWIAEPATASCTSCGFVFQRPQARPTCKVAAACDRRQAAA